ncbi:MAG: hypothetical protein ACRDD1_19820, partial [Planctomycetia bacterium]
MTDRLRNAATLFVFVALWLALAGFARSSLLRDPGTLWHVVVGERILAEGAVTTVDPFSCNPPGSPWMAMQWLAEIGMALLHRIGGFDALLHTAAVLLAGLFAVGFQRLCGAGVHPLPAGLAVCLVVGASSFHFLARPHLVTMAFVFATQALLVNVDAGRARLRALWLLPPLVVLWTNLHGGALGGVGMAGITAGGWMLFALAGASSPVKSRWDAVIVAAWVFGTAAATFVNPYGAAIPRQWVVLSDSAFLKTFLVEQAPLNPIAPEALPILVLGAVYVALLLGLPSNRWRASHL